MKRLIVVIGPRRSGLHAVCNWLIGHFPGHVRFVNDPPIERPPRLDNFVVRFDYDVGPDKIRLIPTLHLLKVHARLLNANVAANLPWPWREVAVRVLKKIWSPRIMAATCSLPVFDNTEITPPETHIILFENLTPAAAAKNLTTWLAAYRMEFDLQPVEKETVIIVLRSPWNCLASTLNHPAMNGGPSSELRSWLRERILLNKSSADNWNRTVTPQQIGELWTAYAKEIIGESHYFKRTDWQMQPVPYDAWIASRELRASIAGIWRRPLDDRGIARTATYGGGSSFDGQQSVAGKPQDLTNRWRLFQRHPTMKALLASPDIRRLATVLEMNIPVGD